MFTGIVENTGKVLAIVPDRNNLIFKIQCSFLHEIRIDQSIAHNGTCLTVSGLAADHYEVTAISETLQKTNLGLLQAGSLVNLERCMAVGGRLDGHVVQGHVDTTGACLSVEEMGGSWEIWFQFPKQFTNLLVEKGSVCVNGVSLTVVETKPDAFSVAIIPYTWQHTNFHMLHAGDSVNLEFDILGKYVQKLMAGRMQ